MTVFAVPRNRVLGDRQWRTLSILGLCAAIAILVMGITDFGGEGTSLYMMAVALALLIVAVGVFRVSKPLDHLSIEGDQVVIRWRVWGMAHKRVFPIQDLIAFRFVAYDVDSLESRVDAWYRRQSRQPDAKEYRDLVRDAGGKYIEHRKHFQRKGIEHLPMWELNLRFKSGERSWTYDRSVPPRLRQPLLDFLVAFSKA